MEAVVLFSDNRGFVLPDALLAVFVTALTAVITVCLISSDINTSKQIRKEIDSQEELAVNGLGNTERCEKACDAEDSY